MDEMLKLTNCFTEEDINKAAILTLAVDVLKVDDKAAQDILEFFKQAFPNKNLIMYPRETQIKFLGKEGIQNLIIMLAKVLASIDEEQPTESTEVFETLNE